MASRVKQLEPSPEVGQPDASTRIFLLPADGITQRECKGMRTRIETDGKRLAVQVAVLERILYEGNEQVRRQFPSIGVARLPYFYGQRVVVAQLLQRNEMFYIIPLGGRGEEGLFFIEHIPHQLREFEDSLWRFRRSLVAKSVNVVERIEQEVRVHLRAQKGKLRLAVTSQQFGLTQARGQRFVSKKQQRSHDDIQAGIIHVASRQRELEELAAVIARFRPTRVYVESSRPAYHDSLFAEYSAGRFKPGRNEIYQVAYRVAGNAALSRIYTVDASNIATDLSPRFPMIDSLWTARVQVDTLRDQHWDSRYRRLYSMGDSLQARLTMLENFLMMAEPKVLARMHGHYLSSGFNSMGDAGPDALSIWWFNRNLRIYNNILQTQPGPEDRILVLFGNGHMSILKNCFQSSPEFEVVELKSLLR